MQWRVIGEAIRLIRKRTKAGTINLNTNGSLPKAVASLCEAGLDAIRLSVNSFQMANYSAYYRPKGYSLADVIDSGRAVSESGGFVSVNLLVFPGFSDRESEVAATIAGLKRCKADLVQMRNLNIDPEVYRELMVGDPEPVVGLRALMHEIETGLPDIRFGYFNPPVRTLVTRRRAAKSGH
jgi:pyruvate-formate lyase-activating enzyme